MKLLDKARKEVDELDLGIVEVGTTKEYQYMLHNDVDAELVDIDITINNKEIVITDYPKTLKALSSGMVSFKWTPSLKIAKGNKTTFSLKASELYKL